MTVLRCTAKLLRAMRVTPVENPSPAANRLGEWTASLVRVSRIRFVIAVSEPTRFGVAIAAAPYAGISFRLQHNVFHALRHIGVPADLAAAEAEAMEPIDIARTNSRSVLGTLNQFAFEAECAIRHGRANTAADITRRLAETVVASPAHIRSPADRVREAFGLPPIDWRHWRSNSG